MDEDFILIDNGEYYNKPEYWPYMPEDIFDALELSELKGALNGEKIKTKVSRRSFEKMLNDYKNSKK